MQCSMHSPFIHIYTSSHRAHSRIPFRKDDSLQKTTRWLLYATRPADSSPCNVVDYIPRRQRVLSRMCAAASL